MSEDRHGERGGLSRTVGRALFLLAAALPVSTVLGTYTEPASDTAGFEWRWSRAVPMDAGRHDGIFGTDGSDRGARDAHASRERESMRADAADDERSPDGRRSPESDSTGRKSAGESAVPFLEELFRGEGDARGPVRIRRDDETLRSRQFRDATRPRR